jgi:hypothetical protein
MRLKRRDVRLVAAETSNPPSVHEARDKIIPLHPVLVCRAVCEVRESCISKLVFLELPKVR